MSRILVRAAAGALFITSQAIAQEKVSFPSTDGDLKGGAPTTITGYLYKPAGAGPFAAVVGLYGCGGLKTNPVVGQLYDQWGKRLSANGYFFLLVDSHEPRGRDNVCGKPEPLREVTRDAAGGLNYLQSRPDVRPDSVALMGWSYGGMATMLTIAAENNFRAAIAFYPDCRSPLDAHWRPREPMLLLIGEADNVVRPALCKELIAKAEPLIDAHFYPNAHHVFDHANLPISAGPLGTIGTNPEARADAIERVTQFLAKQLQ
jgi:dienelactone hydrolase